MPKQVKNNGTVPVSVTAIDLGGELVAALVQPGESVEVPDDFADPTFVDASAPVAPAPAPAPAPEPENKE